MKQKAQGSYKIYVLLTYKITSLMLSSENNNFMVLCCLNIIRHIHTNPTVYNVIILTNLD